MGILEYWRQLAENMDCDSSPTSRITCSRCHSTGILAGWTSGDQDHDENHRYGLTINEGLAANDGGGEGFLRACPCGARLAHRYSLLRCIGQGAFSHVYLLHDHWRKLPGGEGRRWAMKVPTPSLGRLSIHEAALLLGPLSHLPSVPQCQGLIRLPDGRPALLLEYLSPIAGDGLGSRPLWQLLLADCARCLVRLHECGLLHGDIKPENIMQTSTDPIRPRFKLIDYGNCMSQDELLSYYGESGQVASLRYRAPEALVGLRSAMGAALDIWSLGVSLAQLFLLAQRHSDGEDRDRDGSRNGEPYGKEERIKENHRQKGIPSQLLLFTGSSEQEVLGEIMEIGGPLPNHFSQGARWEALGRPTLRSAYGSEPSSFWRRWGRSNWARLLGIHDDSLVDVLSGMLQVDPRDRLSARDILQHPYLW